MRARELICGGLLLAGGPVLADVLLYGETFDNSTNAGGWTFGAPVEGIEPSGGNSGPFLHASQLDTTIPFLRSTGASVFTGDYRARRITSITAALEVIHTDFQIGSRPPAIVLYSENGTPNDPNDDWGAYALASSPLAPAGQWYGFGWSIPSQQPALPSGWGYIEFGPNVPPSRSWDSLVQHVDRVLISFWDPTLFYIFQMWEVGADDIRIWRASTCYPNCDQSTLAPFLNVLDFACFLAHVAAGQGDTYANCDGSTNPPVVNVLDFSCFLNQFAAGCSAP